MTISKRAHVHAAIVVGGARESLTSPQGFARYGFRAAQHGQMTDFFLLRRDGTGLRFSIVMVDLAERLEVGVLHVEEATRTYSPQHEAPLPVELGTKLHVERLVIRTGQGDVESGVVLTTPRGGEVIIVSGAYPYSVQVKMKPGSTTPLRFEPEYKIDQYERQPGIGPPPRSRAEPDVGR